MNGVNGEFVGEVDVEPEGEEGEVGEEEEEVERGEVSLAGGEVVAGGVGVEVVGLSVEGHGDGGFRCAVGTKREYSLGEVTG